MPQDDEAQVDAWYAEGEQFGSPWQLLREGDLVADLMAQLREDEDDQ